MTMLLFSMFFRVCQLYEYVFLAASYHYADSKTTRRNKIWKRSLGKKLVAQKM